MLHLMHDRLDAIGETRQSLVNICDPGVPRVRSVEIQIQATGAKDVVPDCHRLSPITPEADMLAISD